jgi:hypothetical protein
MFITVQLLCSTLMHQAITLNRVAVNSRMLIYDCYNKHTYYFLGLFVRYQDKKANSSLKYNF